MTDSTFSGYVLDTLKRAEKLIADLLEENRQLKETLRQISILRQESTEAMLAREALGEDTRCEH